MTRIVRLLRALLLVGTAFLAATAIPGGLMLLLGIYAPPPEMLQASLFRSFTIPGLALMVVVGGSALFAVIELRRRGRAGTVCAAATGVLVMTFEFVQVVSIGSPVGPSRVMQLLYFVLGTLLVAASLALLAIAPPDPSLQGTRKKAAHR